MLGTYFLDKLEQKVKHVFATKFFTDQESSIYKFGSGTLVISVFVYWAPCMAPASEAATAAWQVSHRPACLPSLATGLRTTSHF